MSESNVIQLAHGNDPNEPDEDIIGELERLLASARSGHLRAIAFATVLRNGDQGTGWIGAAGTRHSTGTAIMILSHRYAEALRRGEQNEA